MSEVNESQRLADQVHRGFFGEAWHGPALLQTLEGVSAEMAAAHPIAGSHSIFEILAHLTVWLQEVRETIGGKQYESRKGTRDWPPVEETSPEAWNNALKAAVRECDALIETARAFDPAKLGTGPLSPYTLLHATAQHLAYHTGQIPLLKRAASLGRGI